VSSRGGNASSASTAASVSGTLAAADARLGELDDLKRRVLALAAGDCAHDVDDAGAAVDLAALERRPLLRPEPGRGREGRQRPVDGGELEPDRGQLVGRVGADGARRRLRVAGANLAGVDPIRFQRTAASSVCRRACTMP
jgi:hypothetical protein